MNWLYNNLSALWNIDIGEGGYYAVDTHANANSTNVKIIGLNSNYWSTLNPDLSNKNSTAYQEGLKQLDFTQKQLENASQTGSFVYMLLHIPLNLWYNNFATIYQMHIVNYSQIIGTIFWS